MEAILGKIVASVVYGLGKKTVQEPEKVLSVVAKALIIILLTIALLGAAASSLVGCFQGVDLDTAGVDLNEAYIYQEVSRVYTDYVALMQEKMELRKEELSALYTETIEEAVQVYVEGYEQEVEVLKKRIVMVYVPGKIVNGIPAAGVMMPKIEEYYETEIKWVEGYWTEETVTKELCTADIHIQLSPVNLAYVLAYLTVTEEDILAQRKYSLNTRKVREYLDYITPVKELKKDISEEDRETVLGDERYIRFQILIYNDILSVYDIADHYFLDDPVTYEMFQLSFDMYLAFLGYSGLYADIESGEVNILYHEGGMNIPHYFQNDYSNVAYGSGTISSSGCAVVCIAMVISYLKDMEYTPLDILKFTGNKYYVLGSGSAWSIFSDCAKYYNLACTDLGKNKSKMTEALQKGKPVIASMGEGTFTNSGHFIVIRGLLPDGHLLINDPNKSNYNRYGTDRFKLETVMKEAKNFWCFE